jgi:ABC-type glycerol-3-phosphate transport system substrate-binding protein
MRNKTLSRREMLKLSGTGAAGAAAMAWLTACGAPPAAEQAPAPVATEPPAPVAVAPTNVAEVQVPTGKELEGFTPKMTAPPEKMKLVYWWGNNYEPAMQFTNEIIARFSLAYPNVEVEPVAGQNCDAFVTAAAAGTPPDLFHTWDCVERMGNWAKRGMIIPLDDYINASGFDLNDYVEGIMDTCKMDGKIWGMVDSAGVFLLWTRPQQFAEIGKSGLPKDTDELWAWANELTTKDADGNIQRLGMTLPTWLWPRFTWIVDFGGELWDTQKNEPTPEHPGVIEALDDLVAQVNIHGVDALDAWSTSIGSQGGEQNPWLAGSLTMQVDGDWSGQQIFDFHPDWEFNKDYGAAAPPPPPQSKQHGDSAVAFWSWPWVVPSNTKQPEWSWELLRYYLAPEYQLNVHPKFKELVVRNSMIDDKRLWWPAVQVAKEIVAGDRKLTTVMPMNQVAGEYSNLLGEAFDKVLHLTESPEDAMARVKAETLKAMAEAS